MTTTKNHPQTLADTNPARTVTTMTTTQHLLNRLRALVLPTVFLAGTYYATTKLFTAALTLAFTPTVTPATMWVTNTLGTTTTATLYATTTALIALALTYTGYGNPKLGPVALTNKIRATHYTPTHRR